MANSKKIKRVYVCPTCKGNGYLKFNTIYRHNYKNNGFVTFNINEWNVARLIKDLSTVDFDHQPTNKLRKIIFKWNWFF